MRLVRVGHNEPGFASASPGLFDDFIEFRLVGPTRIHITDELVATKNPIERQPKIRERQQRDRPGDRTLRGAHVHHRVKRRDDPQPMDAENQQAVYRNVFAEHVLAIRK